MDNKILYTAKFTHHDLKFHKVWWKSDKRFGSWSGQTDRQTDSYIRPQTTFAGGIQITGMQDSNSQGRQKPEALKSLYRSPGYKKNQLVLCKNYVLQW